MTWFEGAKEARKEILAGLEKQITDRAEKTRERLKQSVVTKDHVYIAFGELLSEISKMGFDKVFPASEKKAV